MTTTRKTAPARLLLALCLLVASLLTLAPRAEAQTATQNWDGTTAPARPAGWTFGDATYPAVGTTAPRSTPNALDDYNVNGSVLEYVAYNTQVSGNATVSYAARVSTLAANNAAVDGILRSSGTNLGVDTTSNYACEISFSSSGTYSQVSLSKRTGGVHTGIGTSLSNVSLAANAWYYVTFHASGSTLTLQVKRDSDGFYLTSSNTWQAAQAYCITVTDTSIAATSTQYTGLTFFNNGSTDVLSDDFAFTPDATNATAFSLTGPSGGSAGVASTAFTVAPSPSGATLAAGETVTPSDGGAGGTFSPASLTFASGASAGQTFTYTPAAGATGTVTITATPSPALGTAPTASYAIARAPATFYVDPAGSDTYDGKETAHTTGSTGPWATFGKVASQSAASYFQAGDTIAFKGGQTFTVAAATPCTFSQADALGTSGTLTVTSYGTGQATISAPLGTSAFVVSNGGGVAFSNLTLAGGVTSSNETSATAFSYGIWYHATDTNSNAYVNCSVTNCTISGFDIGVGLITSGGVSSHYDGFRLTNCTLHDNSYFNFGEAHSLGNGGPQDQGTYFGYNTSYNSLGVSDANRSASSPLGTSSGYGACLCDVKFALVERNTVYNCGTQCNNGSGPCGIMLGNADWGTLQRNEVYSVHTANTDGAAIDFDFYCRYCVGRWNYTHDCYGAGLFTTATGSPSSWYGNTYYGNVSVNDGTGGTEASIHNGGASFNCLHNTVIASTGHSPIHLTTAASTAAVADNLFVTRGGGAAVVVLDSAATGYSFVGNDYYDTAGSPTWTVSGSSVTTLAGFRGLGQEALSGVNTGLNVAPGVTIPTTATTLGNGAQVELLTAFDLPSNSPLVDAGVPLGRLGGLLGAVDFARPEADLHATPYFMGAGPDVGASEYTGLTRFASTPVAPPRGRKGAQN